ncbi:MAG: hypothetical protein HYY25_09730 [Candidatus Wallbacteria bacterium]|nr:hypothetical protein [Candidatus Wallbacteria bacterium]
MRNWTIAIACALATATLVGAEDVLPERLLAAPAFKKLLPRGAVAGSPFTTQSPVVTHVQALRAPAAQGSAVWIAAIVVHPAPPARPRQATGGASRPAAQKPELRDVEVLVFRQQGERVARQLERRRRAYGAHALSLASLPGLEVNVAIGVQWAESTATHVGPVEVHCLGGARPVLAFSGQAEGFYFDAEDGAPTMVLYPADATSQVCLPTVYRWHGQRLVPAPAGGSPVADRLLREYDEVLRSYAAGRTSGAAPLMVVDVALSRARLLEQSGRRPEAVKAYRTVIALAAAPGADALLAARASEASSRGARLEAAPGR